MKAMISSAETIMYQTLPLYTIRFHQLEPPPRGAASCAIVPGTATQLHTHIRGSTPTDTAVRRMWVFWPP